MTSNFKIVSKNRRARFDYEILETFEAGIILLGTEVKSLRDGHLSLHESYIGPIATDNENSLYLFNCDIPIYKKANNNHEPRRIRKLLLHKKQNIKLINAVQTKGMSIIALTVYFNNKGLVKLSIALVKGKNTVDKRETKAKRDWSITKQRLLREYNK